jgi:hypothetical protein
MRRELYFPASLVEGDRTIRRLAEREPEPPIDALVDQIKARKGPAPSPSSIRDTAGSSAISLLTGHPFMRKQTPTDDFLRLQFAEDLRL